MLPLGQLVQDSQEIDAGEQVPPAEALGVADLQALSRQLRLFTENAAGEV